MKVGDTVRFLNDVGGGMVKRIEGKIAYVEENGFETPVLIKELVVVLPAGHGTDGAKRMFDQSAFDAGRAEAVTETVMPKSAPETSPEAQAEETKHGDSLNVVLMFEPSDSKRLDRSEFNAVLVNDSNYYLAFTFLRRAADERGWTLVYSSTVAPNELMDLAQYTHETLGEIERVAIQAVAFKKGKEFELKTPVWATRRIDLTKFHKLHCFRPGVYSDTPVMEFPIVTDDVAVGKSEPGIAALKEMYEDSMKSESVSKELSKKFKVDSRNSAKKAPDSANPNKVLPLIEVDLHMDALTDTTSGMEPAHMLEMQLDTVRKTMNANAKRIGQKIVFIHGKGDGVLRKAVLSLLKKEYPTADVQDASFREYGFGASLVTMKQK